MYYEDLYPLISFLPKFASEAATGFTDMLPLWQASEEDEHPYDHKIHGTPRPESAPASVSASPAPSSLGWHSFGKRTPKPKTFDPEKALPTVFSHRPLKPARSPPKTSVYDYVPFLLIFKWLAKPFSRKKKSVIEGASRNALGRKIRPIIEESNVPLQITTYLSDYANCPYSSFFRFWLFVKLFHRYHAFWRPSTMHCSWYCQQHWRTPRYADKPWTNREHTASICISNAPANVPLDIPVPPSRSSSLLCSYLL